MTQGNGTGCNSVVVCTIKVPLNVTQKPSKTSAILKSFKMKKYVKNFLRNGEINHITIPPFGENLLESGGHLI